MPVTTGDEYKGRLRDDRTVFYKGEEIEDVTTHPVTRGMIDTHADLFDFQHDPEYRDVLTYESPTTGDRVSMFYKRPTSPEDIHERYQAIKVWMDYTCGFGNRTTDFISSALTGVAITSDIFDTEEYDYGQNVVEYYEYCRENDLSLTHALVDPQIDRSKASSLRAADEEERPGALRKVDEYENGIVVSGARMLATLGPQADELFVYPFGRYGEDDVAEALSFAIPVDTEGLRLVCRPSLTANDTRNHPLSSRLEEMDTFVVFDQVEVPHERIFINCNPSVANKWQDTAQVNFSVHQSVTKHLAKTEFIFGVALLLAESTGVDEYYHIKAKLGEIAETIEILEAAVLGSEAQAEEYQDTGYYIPNPPSVGSYFADQYSRLMEILRSIGGSGIVGVPSYEDLEAEDPLGSDIATYFRGKDIAADRRLGIQKLAFDVAISGFGGRETLYEEFHSGSPMASKVRQLHRYGSTEELKERVLKFGLKEEYEPLT